MKFKQAYKEMLNGKKIKRPGWGGYWFIEDGKVKIKLKTGKIIENDFNEETITNILADDWEIVEEKKKYWTPKEKEKYFYIEDGMGVSDDRNVQAPIDYCRFNIGNFFKTKIEAEHILEKLKVIHELQKFAYENNEGEIDWSEYDQRKYTIVFDHKSHDLGLDVWCVNQDSPFNIYFTSKELVKNAIKAVGKDRILKYYFDINEEE